MKGQFHDPAPEERGALLEGWVAGLLRARQAYSRLYDDLWYWSPAQGGAEVDFLMRRGREFVGVEVKAAEHPGPMEFTGLRALAGLPGLKRRILVCQCERPFIAPDLEPPLSDLLLRRIVAWRDNCGTSLRGAKRRSNPTVPIRACQIASLRSQ